MNGKIILALVLVAIAASVESKKQVKHVKKTAAPTSADVEALLDPTVSSLPKGQHKLVFKGASGQEQCVVCQPFQGCGCRDVVAIRCELKRLKQKLLRLKRIAAPHKRSHHGRKTDKPKVKVAVKPTKAIKVSTKKPTDKKVKVAIKPKPTVKVSVKKTADKKTEKKPKVKVAVVKKPAVVQPKVKVAVKKPAVEKPKVKLAVKKPKVKVAVKPAVLVKPAVQPAVKLAVQPAVLPAAKVEVKPAVQPLIAPKPVVAAQVTVVKPAVEAKVTTVAKEPAAKPAVEAKVNLL